MTFSVTGDCSEVRRVVDTNSEPEYSLMCTFPGLMATSRPRLLGSPFRGNMCHTRERIFSGGRGGMPLASCSGLSLLVRQMGFR